MPVCRDCQAETPADEMFGAGDDRRCGKCAQKRRTRYVRVSTEARQPGPPYLTFAVALLAGSVFIAQQSPTNLTENRLATIPERIWDGELWRFATTTLPHVGLLHVVFNTYAFLLFGTAIEAAIGPWRWAGLFLLGALGAHSAEFLIKPGVAIGLSGVVYCLFGYSYALRNHRVFAAQIITPSMTKMLFGWLVLCFLLTFADIWRIANWAHLGGLVIGYALGRAEISRRPIIGIAGVGAIVLCLILTTLWMPWSQRYRDYRTRSTTRPKIEHLIEQLMEEAQAIKDGEQQGERGLEPNE